MYDRNSKSPALQWQSKPPDTKNPDTQYENGFFSAEYNPRKDFTIKYDNGDVSGSYSKNSKELVLSKLIDEYNKLSVSRNPIDGWRYGLDTQDLSLGYYPKGNRAELLYERKF